MKLLREVLAGVRRMDDEPAPDQELDLDAPMDDPDDLDQPDDQFSLDPETDGELDDVASQAVEDPDKQGLIRTVKNAHLVYKRETDEGTFDELWVYNVTDLRGELDIKKAILAGTDIPINKLRSPDGSQTYEIWSAGNAEMILIKGLPS